MKPLKSDQFEYEYNTWKRNLEFFKQENALLKYRLSEMVDDNEGDDFLQLAEYFHNKLLLKDEMLKNLFEDLQELYGLLGGFESKKVISEKIIIYHERMRKDILQFEKRFLTLSNEFNEKMLKSSES
ncbi:MAG: hypothetical protein ABI237_03450 [Ginsengibacter sp.]